MYRKIEDFIDNYLKNDNSSILCIYGARQIGKTVNDNLNLKKKWNCSLR